MKNKKHLLWAVPLVIFIYLVSPALLTLTYEHQNTKQNINKMIIIAHRGGASLGPENTLECYKRGIEAGSDMIEIDIHLTKDKQIVICHDETIDRTTNGVGLIRNLTLEEIHQYNIVDSKGNITSEKIPTIDDVFDLLLKTREKGNPCKLLIEIKRTNNIYQGIEELLLSKIDDYGAKNWVSVQSFNDLSLEKIHQLDPTIKLEKLIFWKIPGLPLVVDWMHISYFSYDKYKYISSFNIFYLGLTKSFLNDIHNHKKEVKIWTLEDTNAPKLDVDGIITNRPDLWRK